MTAREPRRRRRTTPAASMPRPGGAEAAASRRTQQASRLREHHVTTDYGYVRKDLAFIAAITAVTLGFIFGMSLIA